MTVKQYKQMAGKPDNQPPESLRARWPGSDEDEVESFEHEGLEKKYWQGFSGKPPIYGRCAFEGDKRAERGLGSFSALREGLAAEGHRCSLGLMTLKDPLSVNRISEHSLWHLVLES